ncbi:P-loop containing nucleoside triphosphate hydrolase protein [Hyaloscypha variabilis F]|uniref:ATP-dependent RNA helicase n=1 Tax=Hyaloscypha variabilis (strain UAMH 11265 / GT02V1 / F) TaxID=1149755 RepID=A0A2J6RG26_HYAVF|nr:P-loop containing nucleoside triphosphate hydrolase protein [Hyaloscypha variabilis F]
MDSGPPAAAPAAPAQPESGSSEHNIPIRFVPVVRKNHMKAVDKGTVESELSKHLPDIEPAVWKEIGTTRRESLIIGWERLDLEAELIEVLLLDLAMAPPFPMQVALTKRLQCDKTQTILVSGSACAGKTLAYVVPIVNYVLKNTSKDFQSSNSTKPPSTHHRSVEPARPVAIVIAPTRLLAKQVHEEATNIMNALNSRSQKSQGISQISLRSFLAVGSSPMKSKFTKQESPQIIVATLGRLGHYVQKRIISLAQVRIVVFDEADEFIRDSHDPERWPQLWGDTGILGATKDASRLLISTNPDLREKRMLDRFLPADSKTMYRLRTGNTTTEFVEVDMQVLELSGDDEGGVITHDPYLLQTTRIICSYIERLPEKAGIKAIICYTNTKHDAEHMEFMMSYLADNTPISWQGGKLLSADGSPLPEKLPSRLETVFQVHRHVEGVNQSIDRIKQCMRNRYRPIIVATDMLSKGLDLKDLDVVFQTRLPQVAGKKKMSEAEAMTELESRLARTGRHGSNGACILFFKPMTDDWAANCLIAHLEGANVDVPEFLKIAAQRHEGKNCVQEEDASAGKDNGFGSEHPNATNGGEEETVQDNQ